VCGSLGDGEPFGKWVKPTFTDHDLLLPGDIICSDCLFWFDEKSERLAEMVGKNKAQRMRNYSHFIKNGVWTPLSKGDKWVMVEMLLSHPFPELAAIAESGQKHIVFRAECNPVGSSSGWVQFEEQSIFVVPDELSHLILLISGMLSSFSKSEIDTGDYIQYRVISHGIDRWKEEERKIQDFRGSLLFNLALFLAQKGEENERCASNGNRSAVADMEGDKERLQTKISSDDLGSVSKPGQGVGVHEQSGKVRQLGLFEVEL
jgi:hypothetical protein